MGPISRLTVAALDIFNPTMYKNWLAQMQTPQKRSVSIVPQSKRESHEKRCAGARVQNSSAVWGGK